MKTLISLDPGLSTGIAIGTYSDTEPYNLTHAFQIEGGVEGFLDNTFSGYDPGLGFEYTSICGVEIEDAFVIAEKFTARGGANAFSYRTEALEPLRVEGAILALGIRPEWVSPQQMYFAQGESKSPVTNAHRWLRENGLHVTGKDVGCKDANDARSAILHSIAWMRRQKHVPTLEAYFKE